MKFNKSIIATFVGSALATTALGVVANDRMPTKNFPIEQVVGSKSGTKVAALNTQVATASGMQNQYDAELGKTTFQWAGKNIAAPDLGAISAENQLAFAADFYLNKLTGKSIKKSKISKPVLANVHDLGRGAKIAKYKQEIAGVEVFNREYNIMMDAKFGLVASSGYFVDKTAPAAIKDMSSAFGDSALAVNSAFSDMGGDANSVTLAAKDTSGKYQEFSVTNYATDKVIVGEPRTKKVFFEEKGQLVAAHYVEIETAAVDSVDSETFSYVISANTGKVLFKNNLTSHAADFNYRAYADENAKPWDSPHGNVMPAPQGADIYAYRTSEYLPAPLVTLSHGPISTMDPWLADDATVTMGNNVSAYVDVIAPNGLSNGDYMAEITSTNTFDYEYDIAQKEYSVHNRKAAIVNLFYMNNYLHDDYYDHGFDEVSGNAQLSNFERGGEEDDALEVQVQDYSGFNNANMSTPADGRSPQMQMYLWDVSAPVNGVDQGVTVTTHADLGLLSRLGAPFFGPEAFEISGDLVRYVDATAPVNDGCEAPTNGAELMGKIAVIDRGVCGFTVKVANAQAAGAVAVIIANNKDGNAVNGMGGTDATITIPSFMITQDEGTEIYALLAADETVSVDMFKKELPARFKGSAWDNGIVAHEWGHYISNRLVGNSNGLSSQQGRAMGEGFSDFHALLLLTEEKDALMVGNETHGLPHSVTTYVDSYVLGIRPYPYSTNVEINPSSFGDVALYPDLVHSPGSVFSNMLWESYVGMINSESHTFAEANSLMKDYLIAGYKMMPIAPTFVEARDAILAAAFANDPADHKIILAAFAKRGMGLGAVAPSRFDTQFSGVVESDKTELSAFNVKGQVLNANYQGLTSGYCTSDNVLDKGETGTVSFVIENRGSVTYENIAAQVEVVGDQDITFANDGMITFANLGVTGSSTSVPLEFTLNEVATTDSIELKVTFPDLDKSVASDYSFRTTVNYDFADRELVGTSQSQDMNTISAFNDFKENVMIGGEQAVGTGELRAWGGGDNYLWLNNNGYPSDVAYETKDMLVGFEATDFQITWYQYYDLETNPVDPEKPDAPLNGWDGGVVEVSINGDEWIDVTEVGGQFVVAGYTGVIIENAESALAGRAAFTGTNQGYERVTFGQSLNGNQVKFRFRIASDTNTVADGWLIDDVTVDSITTSLFSDVVAGDSVACDNRAPIVTAVTDVERIVREGISVSMSVEATDPNGDALTYSWEQTSGPTVTLAGSNTAAISFTSPSIESGSETLTFVASVNDGTVDATQSFSVVVNDMPSMVPARKNSSGGSTGLLAFLLLPLALLRRRKK